MTLPEMSQKREAGEGWGGQGSTGLERTQMRGEGDRYILVRVQVVLSF